MSATLGLHAYNALATPQPNWMVPFLSHARGWGDFELSALPWQARHLAVTHPALPVVTTIWLVRQRYDMIQVLLILTGNSNDRWFPSVSGYAYVMVVTWEGNHASGQPAWMAAYLEHLRAAVASRIPPGRLEAIDVIGLPGGHCALGAACRPPAS